MSTLVKTPNEVSDLRAPEQMNILRKAICPDLTEAELQHFAMVCAKRGLDPLSKQIYAFKDKRGRVAHITGIDGFRAKAMETGRHNGVEGPFWCGKDGQWTDIWLQSQPPAAARFKVWVKGIDRPFVATALWSFYAKNSDVWRQGGPHMLAKCAEALAYRMAFPDVLSGLYTREEMDQAGAHDGPTERRELRAEPTGQVHHLAAARRKPTPSMQAEQQSTDEAPPPADDTPQVTHSEADYDPHTGEVLDAEFEPSVPQRPAGDVPTVHFGKHEGERLDQVPKAYLGWLHKKYSGTGPRADHLRKWAQYLLDLDKWAGEQQQQGSPAASDEDDPFVGEAL